MACKGKDEKGKMSQAAKRSGAVAVTIIASPKKKTAKKGK